METEKIIEGKRVLIVDDEKDVLETLVEIMSICKIDTASSFHEAKTMMEEYNYDIVILDIMGVDGYELLKIANSRNFPALMLTAHALSSEDLKRSAEEGAAYYAPKEMMENIQEYVADVLEGIEKGKGTWERMMDRLSGFYDKKFKGPDWREKEKEFWEKKLKQRIG